MQSGLDLGTWSILIFFFLGKQKTPTEKNYVCIDVDISEMDNFFYLDIRFGFRERRLARIN